MYSIIIMDTVKKDVLLEGRSQVANWKVIRWMDAMEHMPKTDRQTHYVSKAISHTSSKIDVLTDNLKTQQNQRSADDRYVHELLLVKCFQRL